MNDEDTVPSTINIPRELHRRLKAGAAITGTTLGALILKLLREANIPVVSPK